MSTTTNQTILETIGLGKRVPSPEGELVILEDINMRIARGEKLAIVGASGSGKSTLLGLMAGLDSASDGTVYLDGHELGALDEDGRAALRAGRVGFVFQSFQLLQSLTALENVMLPIELADHASPESAAKSILDRVGLSPRLRHYPKQLSGGEQQRVAIARAFAINPALLFADEPTGNLDTATGQKIIELLFDLNRERGTTLILVTHDARLAGPCDRVATLDGGRLVNG
jgi:putative ABC transport system ATP-binding protein